MASAASSSSGSQPSIDLTQSFPQKLLKTLSFELKHALSALMRTASDVVKQSSSAEDISFELASATKIELSKALEFFYCICDQIDQLLLLVVDCQRTNVNCDQFTPLTVAALPGTVSEKPEEKNAISHSQFISVLQGQVAFVKSAREAYRSILDTLPQ